MEVFGSSYVEKPKHPTNTRTVKKKPEEPLKALPSLAELEAEAEDYGREVARKYLEEKLQRLAEEHGEVFPPKPKAVMAPAKAKADVTDRAGKH
jgi:hypothetical protein